MILPSITSWLFLDSASFVSSYTTSCSTKISAFMPKIKRSLESSNYLQQFFQYISVDSNYAASMLRREMKRTLSFSNILSALLYGLKIAITSNLFTGYFRKARKLLTKKLMKYWITMQRRPKSFKKLFKGWTNSMKITPK